MKRGDFIVDKSMHRRIVTLFFTLILFGFLNFFFLFFTGVPFSPVMITGNVINDTGIVQILIEVSLNINISSPENITYNFEKGVPYILPLNVSADFNVDEWRYSLYDLAHDEYVEENVLFTPNTTISAVRWGNLLTVFAHQVDGEWGSKSVIFYINVSNSAPILNISDPVLTCEGDFLNHSFFAVDVDEDDLVGDISPKNPFYLRSDGKDYNISFFSIISGALDKSDVGNYSESISVVDPWDEVDSKDITISVIEINNAPVLLENLGAQTVWLQGENSSFYHVVNVSDIEDGFTSGGNFEFNLTWAGGENLFDIGVADGVMNYTPVVGHEGRVYSLMICAEDNSLSSPHPNISICAPAGGDEEVVCDNFTLTVTDENRPPVIENYTPNVSVFNLEGTSPSSFFVEVSDPDGTIPDINWYVDNVLKEHNENISNDTFSYTFGCGVNGSHSVKIMTTDGVLNDSQEWSIVVSWVDCPTESTGGGGGGGGGDFCIEDWVCEDWKTCQNVRRSYDVGILSVEDYALTRDLCLQNGEDDERYCGFQITSCYDLNECGREDPLLPMPGEKRFCYFTENPNCYDGITNCHDGACEVLVDCGGPCSRCPTCSDGIQNQEEEGIDCGGPCPYFCEEKAPFAMLSTVLIVVSIFLIILILIILWRLIVLLKRKKEKGNNFS